MYGTLLIDPPWWEQGGGQSVRGAQGKYPLMKTRDIAALPVSQLARSTAHLWLWATDTFLLNGDALEVARAWGFTPKADYPWVKVKDPAADELVLQRGLGQYSRKGHEHLLLCVRGEAMVPEPPDRPDSVILAERTVHSRKPADQYSVIERVSRRVDGGRVEIFARTRRPGWASIGNEIDGLDVRQAILQEVSSWRA
jgi:N6-adenosine-specific RNA methylase IME4